MLTTSKLSKSTYDVNIPEVSNLSSEFFYNFYTSDERVTSENNLNARLAPRYVSLAWEIPEKFDEYEYVLSKETTQQLLSKLISEDSSFSQNYVSRNFSEVTDISQASFDVAEFLNFRDINYFYSLKQKKEDLLKLIENANKDLKGKAKDKLENELKILHDVYDGLTDLPAQTLGLDVIDSEGNKVDKQNLFKTLTSSLTLNTKIHKFIVQDLLANAEITQVESDKFANFKFNVSQGNDIYLKSSELKTVEGSAPRLKGYLIRRYRYNQDGNLQEEFVKYIGNPRANTYNDSGIVYGGSYVYSVSVIAELDITANAYKNNDQIGDFPTLTINIESRSAFTNLSCFEFIPPPPPTELKFYFDYSNRNVVITWDLPVNPQADIKQFQIFRRKSLNEPFELIKQYGFDRSLTNFIATPVLTAEFEQNLQTLVDPRNLTQTQTESLQFSNKRYMTGESVDANNIENMRPELRYLVEDLNFPTFKHVDKDFVIDNEFFETTSYIYAMSSVDAHGMISNYSSQYKVTFDVFKNKLVSELICDEGSPRAYPNMNLRIDTFKDSINTTGMKLKNLEIYFTPEYFNVLDEQGKNFNVIAIQKPDLQTDNNKPFYQFQMINLDNSQSQLLRINVEQPPKPPEDIITVIQEVPPEIEPPDIWLDEIT